MAIGTRVIPVLRNARPVQRVARFDLFVKHVRRRHVEPPLGGRVPGDSQHLNAPVGKLDHVLLQRRESEDILDFKILHLTVFTFRVNHEAVAITIHPVDEPIVFKRSVVKVAEHRSISRVVHRQIVVRSAKCLCFLLMTIHTGRSTYKTAFGIFRDC